MRRYYLFLFILSVVILSCRDDEITEEPDMVIEEPEVLVPEAGEHLSGGQATVSDSSPNAFGFQAPGVDGMDELLFFVGNSFFNQNWVSAPASTKARDGLGPFFNARSCAACHFKDGRGQPPSSLGRTGEGMVIRLSIPGEGPFGGPLPEHTYGGQLQDQALLGVMREGGIEILYIEEPGTYPDGTTYILRKPLYKLIDLAYGEMDPSVQLSPRVGPQVIGLGLLEAIAEEDILALADESDGDQDGISGRPNYVWDIESQSTVMGRFGWKANQPSLLQQVASAFNGDIGIKTYLLPEENCQDNEACQDLPDGGVTEIDDDDLLKVVLYSSTLAVPARRNWEDQEVLRGKKLFTEIGCTSCHVPKFVTGAHHRFDALSNQTIRPYTDLLLHDMGEGLADNRPDFEATGREWRTPPLWGIGLFNTVNKHTFYLHDGRARNLEEAILWHGGEALQSQARFKALSITERNELLTFLESL
ncbi:MAG: di-heme oxidoredictase family protein [Bacteroidota bacterium]